MTTDPQASEADRPRPRVTVALPRTGAAPGKLLRALQQAGVEVRRLGDGDDLGDALADRRADVVVVRRDQLPADAAELITAHAAADDAPGLVVLAADDDPVDRVELLAAGAARVLDASEAPDQLGATLRAIAEAESAGGADGPEIRGNEAQPRLADFLSRAASMKRFLRIAERVADAEATLLITGETGVGKERLARAIHAASRRADGPFVAVNCGAMPEQLLESQLFGHVRGAFTGAAGDHRGFFEQAGGGTLFLDEIGEMPAHLQVKILTALQRHEIQRVGAEQPTAVDVRVMAASNRDLRQAIDDGRFREDLYYRLNVIALDVPPLRQRREDIVDLAGLLMQYFRGELGDSCADGISDQAMQAMLGYAWPGNVRELINVVERAMLLCTGTTIELRDLPPEVAEAAAASAAPGAGAAPTPSWQGRTLKQVRDEAVAKAERAFLDAVLRECDGRIQDAAQHAGIGTRSLYDKMRRYGLRKEDYKGS